MGCHLNPRWFRHVIFSFLLSLCFTSPCCYGHETTVRLFANEKLTLSSASVRSSAHWALHKSAPGSRDLSVCIRKLLSKNTTQIQNQSTKTQSSSDPNQSQDDELFGITEQLIEFVKTLTLDTFKNLPLQDFEGPSDNGPTTSRRVSEDLSEWQTRHATLVLSKVKEIAQLRYKLCPGQLKEQQFWRIYFALVKNYVAEYELHAIRLEKLRKMASNEERSYETGACEVEMAETKKTTDLLPSTP